MRMTLAGRTYAASNQYARAREVNRRSLKTISGNQPRHATRRENAQRLASL
jgi:hypothetical protein